MLEARPAGLDPIAVIHDATPIAATLRGEMERLTAVLPSKLERLESHRSRETIRGR